MLGLEFWVDVIFLQNFEGFVHYRVVARVIIVKSDAFVNLHCHVFPGFVFLKLLGFSFYPLCSGVSYYVWDFFLLHTLVYCPGYAMGSFNLETQAFQFCEGFIFIYLVIFSVLSFCGHICCMFNLY